jgi:tryptophanyl-tRNA synthetase
VVEGLRPIRERYEQLMEDRPGLDAILAQGADQASRIASATMARVRERTGLLPRPQI